MQSTYKAFAYKHTVLFVTMLSVLILLIFLICSNIDGLKGTSTPSLLRAEPILLFSNRDEIGGIYLRTKSYFLVHKAVKDPTIFDIDPLESRVFWVEPSNASTIYSSGLDGSDMRVTLKHGLMLPLSIAVDYVAKNLYISDLELNQILVCKMEGTMCHVLHIIDDRNAARSLTLDLAEGFLYWSEYGTGKTPAGIYRSGMDGSRRSVLLSEKDIKCPNGITMDHTANRLYWIDECLATIEYITLDVTERKVLVKDRLVRPYTISVLEDNLLWLDMNSDHLKICNKFNCNMTVLELEDLNDSASAVRAYHMGQVIKRDNPCRANSCSHMCLVAPSNGYKCACPPGFTLATNGETCKLDDSFPLLIVNDESTVYKIKPEAVGSTALTEIPINQIDHIGRIAYDLSTKTLYIADMRTPAIYAVNISSLVRRDLVTNYIVEPKDLALDWTSENLYWVDSSKGTIEVISTKSHLRKALILDLTKPSALALVPELGRMFISTVGEERLISMYNMDGSDRIDLVLGQISAMALAVHPSESLLYWADPHAESIAYMDYKNPKNEPKVFKRFVNATSIAVSGKYVYWTDATNHALVYQHNHKRPFTITSPDTQNHFSPQKVLFSRTTMGSRSFDFPCSINNGGCNNLLCLTAEGGHTCASEDGTESHLH